MSDESPDELSPNAAAQLLAYEEGKLAETDISRNSAAKTSAQPHNLANQFACIDLLCRVWPSHPSIASGSSAVPQRLGDYHLVREIGRGGMGVVYEAEQLSVGRRVALKVLPTGALVDGKLLQRFRNEVRAAAALDHPHIVAVHSMGDDQDHHYYTMQLIRGATIADVIAELQNPQPAGPDSEAFSTDSTSPRPPVKHEQTANGDTSSPRNSLLRLTEHVRRIRVNERSEFFRLVARLGIQACGALQHAHDIGILHRDIKPSNLILDPALDVHLADFGLARIVADVGLTKTGDVVGTLRYMAPEQALAKRVVTDHRADIYSLGATLYELITLQPVFDESDRTQLLKQIAFEEPRPPRKIDDCIPLELETIILTSIAKERNERYQTAERLAEDLKAFLEHRPIKARPASFAQRIQKWAKRHTALVRIAAASTLILTALLAVGIVLLKQAGVRTANALQKTAELLYAADMSVAYQAFEKGWPEEAQTILNRYQTTASGHDPRGLEWYLLQKVVQKPQPITLAGHEGEVTELAVFPDHRRLASVGVDGTLRIWDLPERKLLKTIRLCADELHSVAISPDGRFVAAGGKTAYLCDLEESDRATKLFQHKDTIESIAFSPNGKCIAVGMRYAELCVLSLDGHVLHRAPCASRMESLEFLSNDALLVPNRRPDSTVTTNGVAQIWKSDLSAVQRELDCSERTSIGQITIARPAPDGKYIAAGELYQSRVHIFDAANGSVVTATPHSRDLLSDLAFSPSGKALAVAYLNGQIEYFELQPDTDGSPEIMRWPLIFNAHKGAVLSVKFVDDRTLATGGSNGLIRLWNVPAKLDEKYEVTGSTLQGMKVSPDGKVILCTSPHEFSIVDAKSGEALARHRNPGKDFTAPAWSRSGKRAAVCCRDPDMVFVLTPSGDVTRSIVFPGRAEATAISPNDQTVVMIGNRNLQVCRTDSGESIFKRTLTKEGTTTCFSNDGTRIAYGGKLGKVILLDAASFLVESELVCPSEAKCMAFSPDDQLLATGHRDSMIRIWEVQTGRLRAELVGHERSINELAYSSDGRTLVSAAGDGAVRLWSIDQGREYGMFYQRFEFSTTNGRTYVGLPTDGRYLAVGYGTDKPSRADLLVWRLHE